MFLILTDDVLDIILIDLGIPIQRVRIRQPCFCKDKDFLLDFQGDLGVRNEDRRNQGMSPAAFLAENTLDRKLDGLGLEFDSSLIPTVENETPLLMACAFDSEDIERLQKKIVTIFGKRLVKRKENRYHKSCLLQGT